MPLPKRIIWAFALGYFIFYAPYSGTVKTITSGGLSGIEILPATIAGTLLTMLATITALGWWKYARVVREPHRIASGLATAAIIAPTTMLYSFEGVSIVFALLLMRGGVLLIAPLVDAALGRRVRWFCWAALLFSLASVAYAFAHVEDYRMSVAAAAMLAIYLVGYMVRLPEMTRLVKTKDFTAMRQFFIDEVLVALVALVVLSIVLIVVNGGIAANTAPAMLGGFFYGGLYFFGTLIYLDWRENTFCIPLNRCSSLLAGIAASYVIGTVPQSQLIAAAMMLVALLVLSPAHHMFDLVLAPMLRKLNIQMAPEVAEPEES